MEAPTSYKTLLAAKAALDGWVWFASVTTFPRYAVGIERIPAKDILAEAKKRRLMRYMEEIKKHYRGRLYLLEDVERIELQHEIAVCDAANKRRAS